MESPAPEADALSIGPTGQVGNGKSRAILAWRSVRLVGSATIGNAIPNSWCRVPSRVRHRLPMRAQHTFRLRSHRQRCAFASQGSFMHLLCWARERQFNSEGAVCHNLFSGASRIWAPIFIQGFAESLHGELGAALFENSSAFGAVWPDIRMVCICIFARFPR